MCSEVVQGYRSTAGSWSSTLVQVYSSCTGGEGYRSCTVLHEVHELCRARNCTALVHVYRGTRVVKW
jgi:hypothetical protein